jgi:hypothetical protein
MPESATLEAVTDTSDADQPAMQAKIKPLRRGDAKLFEFRCNFWLVTVPAGIQPEQLDGHAAFWAGAFECREGDEITAIAADRSWVAKYVVVLAYNGTILARLAHKVDGAKGLDAASGPKALPAGYMITQLPPNDDRGEGYVVVRELDNVFFTNSGKPWPSYQHAYESLLQHAVFAGERTVKYFP